MRKISDEDEHSVVHRSGSGSSNSSTYSRRGLVESFRTATSASSASSEYGPPRIYVEEEQKSKSEEGKRGAGKTEEGKGGGSKGSKGSEGREEDTRDGVREGAQDGGEYVEEWNEDGDGEGEWNEEEWNEWENWQQEEEEEEPRGGPPSRGWAFVNGLETFARALVESLDQPIVVPEGQEGTSDIQHYVEHVARGMGHGFQQVSELEGLGRRDRWFINQLHNSVEDVAQGSLRGWITNVTDFLEHRLGASWKSLSSGIDAESVNNFLNSDQVVQGETMAEDWVCSICTDSTTANSAESSPIVDICAGHQFHRNCLREWLKRRNNCPLCRREPIIVGNWRGAGKGS